MAMPKKVPVQFDPEYNLNVQQPIVDTYHPGFARVPPLGNLTAGLRALSGVFNSIAANSERQAAQEAARQDEFRESGELAARTGKQLSADAHPAFRAGFMASTGKAAQSIFLKHVQGISNLAVEAGEIDITGQAFDRFWAEALEESNKEFPSGMDAPYDNQFFVDSFNLDLAEKRGEMQADYIEKATGNVRTQFNGQTEDLLGSALADVNDRESIFGRLENDDLFSQATLVDPQFKPETTDVEADKIEVEIRNREKAGGVLEQASTMLTVEVLQERLDLAHAMSTGGVGGKTTNTDPLFNTTVEMIAKGLLEEAVVDGGGTSIDILFSLMTGETPFATRKDVRALWLTYKPQIQAASDAAAGERIYSRDRRWKESMAVPPPGVALTIYDAKGQKDSVDKHWQILEYEIKTGSYLTPEEKNEWLDILDLARTKHDDALRKGIPEQANYDLLITGIKGTPPGRVSVFNAKLGARELGISESEYRLGHEERYYELHPVPDDSDYDQSQPLVAGVNGERTPWRSRYEDYAASLAEYVSNGKLTGPDKFIRISTFVEQVAADFKREAGTGVAFHPVTGVPINTASIDQAKAYLLYQEFKKHQVLDGLFAEGDDERIIFEHIEEASIFEGKTFLESVSIVRAMEDLPKSLNKRFSQDALTSITNKAEDIFNETFDEGWFKKRVSGPIELDTFKKQFSGIVADAGLYYLRKGYSETKSIDLAVEYTKANWVFQDDTPIRLPLRPDHRKIFNNNEQRTEIMDALRKKYENWSISLPKRMVQFEDITDLVFMAQNTFPDEPKYVLWDKKQEKSLDLGQTLRQKPDGTMEQFRPNDEQGRLKTYWTSEDLIGLIEIDIEPESVTADSTLVAARARKEAAEELEKRTKPVPSKSRLKGKSLWGHDIEPPKKKGKK